jgi:hypothetical protein
METTETTQDAKSHYLSGELKCSAWEAFDRMQMCYGTIYLSHFNPRQLYCPKCGTFIGTDERRIVQSIVQIGPFA